MATLLQELHGVQELFVVSLRRIHEHPCMDELLEALNGRPGTFLLAGASRQSWDSHRYDHKPFSSPHPRMLCNSIPSSGQRLCRRPRRSDARLQRSGGRLGAPVSAECPGKTRRLAEGKDTTQARESHLPAMHSEGTQTSS
mmetsp:Transcript_22821/g.42894  ORF Transcript_22821/g.42894 Transcript_22821/m.42894 type:complete len:141 (-) Transcript_22821:41-463(-)